MAEWQNMKDSSGIKGSIASANGLSCVALKLFVDTLVVEVSYDAGSNSGGLSLKREKQFGVQFNVFLYYCYSSGMVS